MFVTLSALLVSSGLAAQPATPSTQELQSRSYSAYSAIQNHAAFNQFEVLDRQSIDQVFTVLKRHPVADLAVVDRYDTNGEIGFCYGRAMTGYLLLKQKGIKETSVRKLFIVGDLRSNPAQPEWRFHVTVLVKTSTDWYALDPIFDKPLTASEWIRRVRATWDSWHRETNPERRARLYLTPPQTVMPDIRTFPSSPALESGNRIIELSFRPEGRADFVPRSQFSDSLFELGPNVAGEFFLTVQDDAIQPVSPQFRTFDFVGLSLDVLVPAGTGGVETKHIAYHYKGYFTDLLRMEFARSFPQELNPLAEVLPLGDTNAFSERRGRILSAESPDRLKSSARVRPHSKPRDLGSARFSEILKRVPQ